MKRYCVACRKVVEIVSTHREFHTCSLCQSPEVLYTLRQRQALVERVQKMWGESHRTVTLEVLQCMHYRGGDIGWVNESKSRQPEIGIGGVVLHFPRIATGFEHWKWEELYVEHLIPANEEGLDRVEMPSSFDQIGQGDDLLLKTGEYGFISQFQANRRYPGWRVFGDAGVGVGVLTAGKTEHLADWLPVQRIEKPEPAPQAEPVKEGS